MIYHGTDNEPPFLSVVFLFIVLCLHSTSGDTVRRHRQHRGFPLSILPSQNTMISFENRHADKRCDINELFLSCTIQMKIAVNLALGNRV